MKKVGIIGMPNVGKSSLFNLLSHSNVPTSIYPFCTIKPNHAVVPVPQKQLEKLAQLISAIEVIPATIELVDVAGLVKNASKGEGLGNQFLSYILATDLILHVVRGFIDEKIPYMSENPVSDIETINLELILKDIELLERRIKSSKKREKEEELLLELKKNLEKGILAKDYSQIEKLNDIEILTKKPMIYLLNINEKGKQFVDEFYRVAQKHNVRPIVMDVLFELELLSLTPQEREELCITENIVDELITAIYEELKLITFFTIERRKLRAWSVDKNTTAYEAASLIHSDMQRGFVVAEVINFTELQEAGSISEAKTAGLIRYEGKDYTIKDADIITFRFTS